MMIKTVIMVDAFEAPESAALQFGPSSYSSPCLLFICPVNLALVCSKVVQWRCKTLHLLPNSEEWHPEQACKLGRAPPSERSRPYSSRCNRAAAGQSAQLYEASHCCYWVCPTSKSASLLLVKSCQERDISGRVTRTSKPHRRNLSSQESRISGTQVVRGSPS